MWQIAKLLFATTLLSIFVFLLIFTSVGQAGNGGEYWGFDGAIEPHIAAARSFETGDYRYLEVDLTDALGKRVQSTPMYSRCPDHPLDRDHDSRPMVRDAIHGADSIRLAEDFALQFNNRMNALMEVELGICCGDCFST